MKRTAAAFVLLAGLGGGCMTTDKKSEPVPMARTSQAAVGPYGAVAAVGALPPHGLGAPINARTSIRFGDPQDMRITWYGPTGLSDTVLTTPARYNFAQGGIYRLKLSNIPGRGAVDLYPTLEIVPATAKTATYLAH